MAVMAAPSTLSPNRAPTPSTDRCTSSSATAIWTPAASSTPVSPPPSRKNQYGASLGGPIKKNKLFFFVNYEGIQQVLDTNYPVFVPSAAVHQGIVSGQQVTNINPAAAAMLALYPIPNNTLAGNPDVGQISVVSTQQSPENFFTGRV